MTADTPLPLVGPGGMMRATAARFDELRRDVARPVLVIGARGLGKRYLAQRIHLASARGGEPVHVLDARDPSVSAALAAAQGGVVLLRQADQLSAAAQAQLEALLGTDRIARLLVTSGSDLLALAREGRFRETLAWLLQVAPLQVPAIAERDAADRAALAAAVLAQTADGDASLPVALDGAALARVMAWHWPDNLREFEATLALAQLRARGGSHVSDAHLALPGGDTAVPPAGATLGAVQRWHMHRALEACHGNRTHAAKQLGISRMTLLGWLREADAAGEAP